MTMQCKSTTVSLRRLSTLSYIEAPGKRLATKWIWYWKDDNGWKEYDGKVSSVELFSISIVGRKLAVYITWLLYNEV